MGGEPVDRVEIVEEALDRDAEAEPRLGMPLGLDQHDRVGAEIEQIGIGRDPIGRQAKQRGEIGCQVLSGVMHRGRPSHPRSPHDGMAMRSSEAPDGSMPRR